MSAAPISSNQAKYESGNPVVQRLLGRFFGRVEAAVAPLGAESVLDAGCGEGEALHRLAAVLPGRVAAVDLEDRCVAEVRARFPAVEASRGSVTDLAFADASFDLVLCLEVLEHLDDPAAAVAELARVSSRHVVVSVPYEPWFRLGNLLRGNHLAGLGNHPEHVNHFNRASLRRLLETSLDVAEVSVAFPWLVATARVRGA
jgi:SAM-dependent methyltransferase